MLKRFIIGPVLLSIIFEFGCIKKPELNIEELKIKIPNEWSIPIHSDNDITGEWWVAFNNQELNNFLSQIKNESPDFLSLIQNQKVYARLYDGEKFDCGSKKGFVHATIALALRDNSISKDISKIIKEII